MIAPTYVAATVMAGTKRKPYGTVALKNAHIDSIDAGRAAANIAEWRLVPETKGKSLEQIEAHWRSGKSPRQL